MLPSNMKMVVRATFDPLQSTSLWFHGWSASRVGRKSARMPSALNSLHLLWILDPLIQEHVQHQYVPSKRIVHL